MCEFHARIWPPSLVKRRPEKHGPKRPLHVLEGSNLSEAGGQIPTQHYSLIKFPSYCELSQWLLGDSLSVYIDYH